MANPFQKLGHQWMSGWGNVGGALEDIYGQVAHRRAKTKGKPKSKPQPPITSATTPQAAAKQIRPGRIGQTAGSKKAIIEGINRDSPF